MSVRMQVLAIGAKSLLLHKLRSFLTILGVVFGVGSVVAMLAVGEGASFEVRQQLMQLGPDRIIIRSVLPESLANESGSILDYGVTLQDASRLKRLVPSVAAATYTFEIDKDFWAGDREHDVHVVGTTPDFRDIHRLEPVRGRFLGWSDLDRCLPVAVLGAAAAEKLFGPLDPVGQTIKHSSGHYTIVGVLRSKMEQSNIGHSPNDCLFLPYTTAKMRFENIVRNVDGGAKRYERVDVHQIGLRIEDLSLLPQSVAMIRTLLEPTHSSRDFEMVVPYELLQQAERTKQVFNIVLGSIASISLLVGGIGIMNIMMATVTERTREIGIRRALGATRRNITLQFLVESVILSTIGGVLGLLIGVLAPMLVTQLAGVTTVVTWWSLVIPLAISVGIGVLFGLYPARRAARMEPVMAARHA